MRVYLRFVHWKHILPEHNNESFLTVNQPRPQPPPPVTPTCHKPTPASVVPGEYLWKSSGFGRVWPLGNKNIAALQEKGTSFTKYYWLSAWAAGNVNVRLRLLITMACHACHACHVMQHFLVQLNNHFCASTFLGPLPGIRCRPLGEHSSRAVNWKTTRCHF